MISHVSSIHSGLMLVFGGSNVSFSSIDVHIACYGSVSAGRF